MHKRCEKAAKAHGDLHERLGKELEKRKSQGAAKPATRKPAARAKPAKAKT